MSRHGLRSYLVIVVALVALTQLSWGCGDPAGPVKGELALKHAREILAFGPRPPGSPAIRNVAEYIGQRIRSLGLEPKTDRWTDPAEKIEFENVWVEIPGRGPADGPVLLLAAHYDSKLCQGHTDDPAHNFEFVGALDSAGACGLLLELARVLKKRENAPNIWIAWFDGEESIPFVWDPEPEKTRALFGSKRFAEKHAARIKAMVLFDLIGAADMKIDRDLKSNPDLLQIFAKAAETLGESDRVFRFESPMTDDHIPFQDRSVKVIDLIDYTHRDPNHPKHDDYAQWWHSPADTADKLSADSLALAGNLLWVALPAIEAKFFK